MRLSNHVYKTVDEISGQLIFVEGVHRAKIGELVKIVDRAGNVETDAEVLQIEGDRVMLQLVDLPLGMQKKSATTIFTDKISKVPVSEKMVNRFFSGSMQPLDNMPMFIRERDIPVTGYVINPVARKTPEDMVKTGFSFIDGLNTLVMGQKLPIFSLSGLPSARVVVDIINNAFGEESESDSLIVFAALGLSYYESEYYMNNIKDSATDNICFLNMADDPLIERLLTPRYALSTAEYFAYEKKKNVLVIIADITNYCEALREISALREELPGRRGYPGYMYSDLASIYERAGRVKGMEGSVTLLPVLTVPEDDITHPIADLTGYITEGQIVFSRDMQQAGVYPPVDILKSLSRLMQKGMKSEEHKKITKGIFSNYAKGCKLRQMESIVGREGMSKEDINLLNFADTVENEFLHQEEKRSLEDTLEIGDRILKKAGPR